MWFDDMDIGGRGIVRPATGPLGRALREARLELLLSQERVARMGGASQQAVSRLELGGNNWALFVRLVKAIGGYPVVTIEPLLNDRQIVDRMMAGEPVPQYDDGFDIA